MSHVTFRRITRRAARSARNGAAMIAAPVVTRRWARHSRLMIVSDDAGWAIQDEARMLNEAAQRLGIRTVSTHWSGASGNQSQFFADQFALLGVQWRPSKHRLGVAIFHGYPGTPGAPEFDIVHRNLRERHGEIDRVRVSYAAMHDTVLESGIDADKVFRIPIGVDPAVFRPPSGTERTAARAELGLDPEAFVVGSFQKDGVGWGDGLEPKWIKGPDVLLQACEFLQPQVPRLVVLLSGPSRGYVVAGLRRLGIEYRHVRPESLSGVGRLYHALDACVVASRQEGGPKAVLEAMASRTPLVTTRVGQAQDLVEHGVNGWMLDIEDAEGLAAALAHIAAEPPGLVNVLERAQETAAAHSPDALLPCWRELLTGFVELESPDSAR